MGCPVDPDLIKFVRDEVHDLADDVEQLEQTASGEAQKIRNALQNVNNEIDEFTKRIAEMKIQIEADRRKQEEQTQFLFAAHDGLVSEIRDLQSKQDKFNDRVSALESPPIPSNFQATVPVRNPCFCGRSEEMQSIAGHLQGINNCCTYSAIWGLGGVGKTSIAVEYLWRFKDEYNGGVFWISGENSSLFQISVGEMARQIGTFENDFSTTLSKTLSWLHQQRQIWCLVVDNLDEREMSLDMRKLLTGHWKQGARGHIIVTTRREAREISEDTGISERACVEVKCMTEEDGIQFLRLRTEQTEGGDEEIHELVRELGGLPLALDQAAAYIRCLRCPVREYLQQYKKQKLVLLKKKEARHLVDYTSRARLAVHTTWLMNFEHIKIIADEMELGETPTLFMEVCAFLGPDNIPYEVINEGLPQVDSPKVVDVVRSSLGPAEIVSLLTKFSLFQRYGENSFGVHRLVQEVVRCRMDEERKGFVLSCATRFLHQSLVNVRSSPVDVCDDFVEDAVFSVDNPPSLHTWGKLANHATYLQYFLLDFTSRNGRSVAELLYTVETVRLFNEAAIFFSVSREKVKAQEMQERKLDCLVHLKHPLSEESLKLLLHFDIPLKDRDYKLISRCMKKLSSCSRDLTDAESKAHQLREEGNQAVKRTEYGKALDLYTKAILHNSKDYRLYSNRALCYLKLSKPQKALNDCEECLLLQPNYSKALQRKAWALHQLLKSGSDRLKGCAMATAAVAFHVDNKLQNDHIFRGMFPDVPFTVVDPRSPLEHALMVMQKNHTFLLPEGEYNSIHLEVSKDVQIVGLGPRVYLNCVMACTVLSAKCYFENVTFPTRSGPVVCVGEQAAFHMNRCKISGGRPSCEEFPDCNGGPGCVAATLGKPKCDRTFKFGFPETSGEAGEPGIQVRFGGCGHIENCEISSCGGGGAIVDGEGSRLVVRSCQVFKNHQVGLEAREGGRLVVSENRIYNNGHHGILVGPLAGRTLIRANDIFENRKTGVIVTNGKEELVVEGNDIHHNMAFGLSLDDGQLSIADNKIFENGFWGILCKSRTSANIRENVIFSNKCGGIFLGVNFSGRISIQSNVVRDHAGPWLQHGGTSETFGDESTIPSSQLFDLPPGEREYYSLPPTLKDNEEFNNIEGIFHPTVAVERMRNRCCHCSTELRGISLKRCSDCFIAVYCGEKCRDQHRSSHESLCDVLKSRYSTTIDMNSLSLLKDLSMGQPIFGKHLKGIGKGPRPKRNMREAFIVKIQTLTHNCHPLQSLRIYDRSLTVNGFIRSPEVFSVIMECGVLGQCIKSTSKKAFFWATFADGGKKLDIFLNHLAPYQEW